MPAKDTTLGSRVTQAQPFAVFLSKTGGVAVRIGTKRAYASAREVTITAGFVRVVSTAEGLLLTGEGVVRQHHDAISITA